MAAKSIITVEVDSAQFDAFQKKYDEFQDSVKKQPQQWAEVGEKIEEVQPSLESIHESVVDITDVMVGGKFTGALTHFGKIGLSASKSWTEIRKEIEKSSKGMSTLARLGINARAFGGIALTAGVGALVGGAALTTASMFGLAEINRSSRSLGLKPGQEQAFTDIYGAAGGSSDLLAKIAAAKADPTQWRFLQAAGITPQEIQTKGTTELSAEFMEKAGAVYRERGGIYANAMGLTNFMDLNSLRLAGSYNQTDYADFAKKEANAEKQLEIDQKAADAATEFTQALKTAKDEIENSFMAALVPLAPELRDMAKSIADSLSTTFKSPEFKADLEGVAGGFKELFHTLGWLAKTEKPAAVQQAQVGHGLVEVAKDVGRGDFSAAWKELNKPLPGPQPTPAPKTSSEPLKNPRGGQWTPSDLESLQRGIPARSDKWSGLEKQRDLPSGLLGVVERIESHGNPKAVSPVGASGAFQIMPAVGKQYGLSQQDLLDEQKSAPVAAQLLGELKKKYQGDIAKTLAAYNWGQGNLDKDIAAHGEKWRNFLPTETKNYLNKAQNLGVNLNVTVTAPAGSSTNVTAGALAQ